MNPQPSWKASRYRFRVGGDMERLSLSAIRTACVCIDHAWAAGRREYVRMICRPGEPWVPEVALLLEQGFRRAGVPAPGQNVGEMMVLYERMVKRE